MSGRPMSGFTRREWLAAGTAASVGSMAGLTARPAFSRDSVEQRPGAVKSVIMMYLHGGAATQDMFDLKPRAPAEIRGEFKPIDTNVPGIQISEHLPLMARWMHRTALVRSVHHHAACHNTLPSFTGDEQQVEVVNPVPKDTFPPGMGAVCEFLKPAGIDMPHYVALPSVLGWGYFIDRPGPHGGFLGKRYDPLCSAYTPAINAPTPAEQYPMWLGAPRLEGLALPEEVTAARLAERRRLLAQIEGEIAGLDASTAYERVRRRAFGLMTTEALRKAFDLEQENPLIRDRYGRNLFGSSALVARRLVEAGVRFVDVYWDGYSYRQNAAFDPYWDTHSNNFIYLRECNLPHLDRTFDAMMGDLEARGLLDTTLVVISTDFGRTPRVNSRAGRDHWTDCYSVVLAGGGIKGGTVYGASDGQAAYIKDLPVRPSDICSTIYELLGIDHHLMLEDRTGRPISISHGGEPLSDVIA